MILTRIPLLVLILSCLASVARVEDARAASNPAEPECTANNTADARSFVNRHVALLDVALVHADFENMKNYFRKLTTYLDACIPAKDMDKATLQGMVCDDECFAKRAEVPLFIMSELPYLKSGSIIRTSGMESFQDGIDLANQGLAQLARMNFGSTNPNGAPEQEPFNRFLHSQARLNSIKARLLLAHGDVLYQSISSNRATSLRMRLNAADDPKTKEVDETSYATTEYEKASWAIQEALLDLPETKDFSTEQFEFKRLQNDVIERLRSIHAGNLFLNIDPEAFTTLNSKELLGALSIQLNEIKGIEDNLDGIIGKWKETQLAEDRQSLENDRIRDARSIEQKSYELAALSEGADRIRDQYAQAMYDKAAEITKLGIEADEFDIKNNILAMKFEIEKAKRQAQNQKTLIAQQSEADKTQAARDSARDKRDEFRWMIDATLASFNLNFQIAELKSEMTDLNKQIEIRGKDAQALEETIGSLNTEKRLHVERIDEYKIGINKLNKQQSAAYVASRRPLVQAICALLAQKAKLTGSSGSFTDAADGGGSCASTSVEMSDKQYWEKLLKVRKETIGEDGKILVGKLEAIRRCLVENPSSVPGADPGTSKCDADGSAEKLAKDIFKEEKRIFEKVEAKNYQDQMDKIDAHIDAIKYAQIGIGTSEGLFTLVQAAGALRIPVAGQRIVVGVAGMGPAAWVETDIGEKAQVLYDTAMTTWQHANEMVKWQMQWEHEKKQLESARLALLGSLNAAKERYNEKGLEDMLVKRTIADLTGQDYRLQGEELATLADAGKFLTDKANAESFIKSETARVDSEIDRVKAELDKLKVENGLLAMDIQAFNSRIAQENIGIQSLDYQIKGIRVQQDGIKLDIARLTALHDAAGNRQTLVKNALATVENLKNQAALMQSIVDDLTDKLKAQMSLLTESQIKQVADALADDEAEIQIKITAELGKEEFLAKSKQLGAEAQDLNAAMTKELSDIAEAIKTKRSEILAAAAKPDTFDQGHTMYLASQIVTADLTRGANEYLRAKKEKMQYVNFLYNLYRSRLNVMSTLVGLDDTKEDIVPYILNYDQLMKAVRNCSDISNHPFNCGTNSLAFSQKELLFTKSQFMIPADSGFMQELLSKGRVRFEITPAALPPLNGQPDVQVIADHIKAKGSFQQWDWQNMNTRSNMSLMNIVLGLEGTGLEGTSGSEACDQQLVVRHLGYGIRNRPLNEDEGVPNIAIDSERLDILRAFKSDDSQNPEFKKWFQAFDGLNSLPENMIIPETVQSRELRYLGAPLIGAYEIELLVKADTPYVQSVINSCFAGRSLRIGVNYAMPSDKIIRSNQGNAI